MFTPVAAVQDALRVPSVLVALLQLVNGVCFVMVTMYYYSILCSVGGPALLRRFGVRSSVASASLIRRVGALGFDLILSV